MTHDNMISILTEWKDCITQSDTTCDDLLKPLMLDPESPLYQTIWALQGAYTRAVATIVGDDFNWLEWFTSENDMGAREMQACPGAPHPMRKIKTVVDLAWLIEESK